MNIDWSRIGGPNRTCPDCYSTTKKHDEPTLSSGGFWDQIVVCSKGCGWCGVNSVMLTDREIEEWHNTPTQPRLL